MGQGSLISIPGWIKDEYLPFRLESYPQYFTFRQKEPGQEKGGVLNICPSSLTNQNLVDDISYAACFGKNATDTDGNTTFTKHDLFNFIPGIQIREFLPDTRLDQCINFFTDILGTVTDIFTKDKDALKSLQNKEPDPNPKQPTKSFFTVFTEAMNWSLKYLTGTGNENLYDAIGDMLNLEGGKGQWSGDSSLDNYILNFPFILYYKFQSCETTALYELPCIKEDKLMYSAEGKGWDGASEFEVVNQFRGNIPVLGPLLKTILGNVRVNFMPWWDSTEGHKTAEPPVTVKFDLFNDSADAAIMNFIFVNTIVPGNKWLQYNMFQHSSNLYDIKIEGYNRLFACTGKFDVKQQGVLREPNKKWLDKLMVYKNPAFGISTDDILKNHLIKIPDVYSVTLEFNSILPANFNNYLYTWTKNNNIMEEYKDTTHEDSVALKMFNTGLKDFASKLKTHWDAKDFKNDAVQLEKNAQSAGNNSVK